MSYKQITQDDRVSLAALLRVGKSKSKIAQELYKDKSTIKRELKRNKDPDGVYRGRSAQKKTRERRRLAKQPQKKIENNKELRNYIIKKLKKYWSPEQIAGRWNKKKSDVRISHETIYQFIYNERPDLKSRLRCQKGKYRRRRGTKKREKQREFDKKRSIDKRPAIVEERIRLGDWEGDTIVEKGGKGRISTHVDRKSGYLIADKLVGGPKLSQELRTKTNLRFKRLPKKKRLTITYDRGTEFSDHERIEKLSQAKVFFAHAYHSWERGTNENTNGLLRQFFPKKSSFAKIKQKDVSRVERLLNYRPRKRLNYLTPHEIFIKGCSSD